MSQTEKSKSKKSKIGWVLVPSLLVNAALGATLVWPDNGEIVATVNKDKITKDELYDVMVKQAGNNVLEGLISNKLIEQEAKKQKVTASLDDVKEEVDAIKASYGGDDAFQQALTSNGMTIEELKKDLTLTVQLKKILSKSITVTEEEKKTYFKENKEAFDEPEQVRASHILVYDEKEAKKIQKKLKDGAEFSALAKEFSNDQVSALQGGDLGFFPKGQMEKEFEEAAFSLNKGEVSGIVSYQSLNPDTGEDVTRYHIIQVTDKKKASKANYDEKEAEIEERIQNDKFQSEYQSWIEEVKSKSKIENSLEKEKK